LLPASAKRLVELHKTLVLVAAVLRQGQLGAEERALVVENFQIGGDAAAVLLERCADRIAEIFMAMLRGTRERTRFLTPLRRKS
jgi:hypothetical protein